MLMNKQRNRTWVSGRTDYSMITDYCHLHTQHWTDPAKIIFSQCWLQPDDLAAFLVVYLLLKWPGGDLPPLEVRRSTAHHNDLIAPLHRSRPHTLAHDNRGDEKVLQSSSHPSSFSGVSIPSLPHQSNIQRTKELWFRWTNSLKQHFLQSI